MVPGSRIKITGCPVPIFSYFFFNLFLFSPFFKLKPIFPIFLAIETTLYKKIENGNKIENGIIVVCVFE